MKNIFLTLFCLVSLTAFAQSNLNFAIRYNVSTSTASSNNYTIAGTVSDFNGVWDANTVAVGDSIFYLDGDVIFPLIISSISVHSGNSLTCVAASVSPFVSTSNTGNLTGQIAISRKTATGYCPVPASTNEYLRAAMENRFKQNIISGGTTETTSNGLNKVGNDIRLGGSLTTPTTITASLSNPIQLAGIPTSSNANSTGTESNQDFLLIKGGTGDTIKKVPSQYFVQLKDTSKFAVKNNISGQPTFTTIPPTKTIAGASNDSIALVNPSTGGITVGKISDVIAPAIEVKRYTQGIPLLSDTLKYALQQNGNKYSVYSLITDSLIFMNRDVKVTDFKGTSFYAQLLAADASTQKNIYIPAGTYNLSASITVSSPIFFEKGAIINVASGQTLTINSFINDSKEQIFGVTSNVVFSTKSVDYVRPEWFGAIVSDGVDDYAACQKGIDVSIASKIGIFQFSKGQYELSDGLLVYRISGGAYQFVTLSIKGDASTYDGASIRGTQLRLNNDNIFAIGIQRGRDCLVENIQFVGFSNAPSNYLQMVQWTDAQWAGTTRTNGQSPHAAICLDPYANGVTSPNQYPSKSSFYTTTMAGGTSFVKIKSVNFRNFFMGIADAPTSYTQNGDNVAISQCDFSGIAYCFMATQAQNRGNSITDCSGSNSKTFVDCTHFGQGSTPRLNNINLSGFKYLIFTQLSTWDDASVSNTHCEALFSLGASGESPISFNDCDFSFLSAGTIADGGDIQRVAPVHLYCSRAEFNNCLITSSSNDLVRGQFIFNVHSQVQTKFNNCEFRGFYPIMNENVLSYSFNNTYFSEQQTVMGGIEGVQTIKNGVTIGDMNNNSLSNFLFRWNKNGSKAVDINNNTVTITKDFEAQSMGNWTVLSADTLNGTLKLTGTKLSYIEYREKQPIFARGAINWRKVNNNEFSSYVNPVISAAQDTNKVGYLGLIDSIKSGGTDTLVLKNVVFGAPTTGAIALDFVRYKTFIPTTFGDMTNGSNVITNIVTRTGTIPFSVGQYINAGDGLSKNLIYITAVNNGARTITVSSPCALTQTGIFLYDANFEQTGSTQNSNMSAITTPLKPLTFLNKNIDSRFTSPRAAADGRDTTHIGWYSLGGGYSTQKYTGLLPTYYNSWGWANNNTNYSDTKVKISSLSLGNPLELNGLQVGTTTGTPDSIISSASGVLKRVSIDSLIFYAIRNGINLTTTIGSLRVPRLTTTQRGALNSGSGSVTGDVIYNTTTSTYQVADGGTNNWVDLATGTTTYASASYDNVIAAGSRDSVVITVSGLTTSTGAASVYYVATVHQSGIVISPAKVESGQIKIYLDNFAALSKAFSGILKVMIIRL